MYWHLCHLANVMKSSIHDVVFFDNFLSFIWLVNVTFGLELLVQYRKLQLGRYLTNS